MEAASRRAERESLRRFRQLQRDQKAYAKTEARQQAAREVELYENQIERLLSIHKESPEKWDWNSIFNTSPPAPPDRWAIHETRAVLELNAFKPGFLDNLMGRAKAKRQTLEQAVETARAQDEEDYQRAYQEYFQRYTAWNERCQLASRIVQGDTQAYADALLDFNPFADISELGTAVDFLPHDGQFVEFRVVADGDRLIPNQIKSLTPTGKLTLKPMPRSQFFEMYRDFVCGLVLRIGREVFAFLPVQTVLANIQTTLLNTRTGHQAIETILSVLMSRQVFARLNFNCLDPSDAMENFPHRTEYKKTSGFGPVEPLTCEEALDQQKVDPDSTAVESQEKSVPTTPTDGLEQLVSSHPIEDGCCWIPAGTTACLVGADNQTKLTLGICRRIAAAIESAGYCIEPDARFGNGAYDSSDVVGVFKPAEGEGIAPSPAYHGAANLLRLCVLVAAADGTVDKHELNVFRQVIENQLHFSQTELKRLAVLERILAENEAAGSRTLGKVAKAVVAEKRLLVAQVLVRVAAVDHVITKSEYRALERVFKTFELPPQTLADLLLQVCPSPDEVTIQNAGVSAPGEQIPQRGAQDKSQAFSLDMSKVYSITNETREVVGILSVVMEDERKETSLPPQTVVPPQPQSSTAAVESPEGKDSLCTRFTGLDVVYHPILERLLSQDSWSRSDFHALANEFQLMPLNIHDVINEWADESLGDFILEGEDPILIRRELILKKES